MRCAGAWVLLALCAVMSCGGCDASTTERVQFCGGWLTKALSMVCRSFNSPNWEKSSVGARNRVKREYGIADECCLSGCTWSDLRMYCADDYAAADAHPQQTPPAEDVTSSPQSSLEEQHLIADRSAEAEAAGVGVAAADADGDGNGVEGGAVSFRSLFGRSEVKYRSAARSAPVVGTVSPLLAWGRTVHAEQPSPRLVYVTI